MKKRNFVDMKRLVALLMIGIMLTTVVGCKSNTVDQEPVDDDAQIEDVVDNPTQDVEKEEVQDELTEIDKEVLGLFEFWFNKIPELIEQCETGNYIPDKTPQDYYEAFVNFAFSTSHKVKVGDYTFSDMSKAGQIQFLELMSDYDSQIYDKLLSEYQELFAEEHTWIPYAKEMLQLTDAGFDENVIEAIAKKWLEELENPNYRAYYRDFYEKLIVPSL